MKWEALKEWIPWAIPLLAGAVTFFTNPLGYFRKAKTNSDHEEVKTDFDFKALMRREVKELHAEINNLQKEVRNIRDELHRVKLENMELKANNQLLLRENQKLKQKNG